MGKKEQTSNFGYILGMVGFTVAMVLGVIRKGTTFGAIMIALAIVVAICIVMTAASLRRLSSVVENAANRRPDAQIIPAYTTGESHDLAVAIGGSSKGWMQQGGNPIAVAVSPDRVEVWARKESTPRLTLPTSDITDTGVMWGQYGTRNIDTIGVVTDVEAQSENGTVLIHGGLMFVPAYRPIRNMGGSDTPGLMRASETLASAGIVEAQV